jgi:hypothetical protein
MPDRATPLRAAAARILDRLLAAVGGASLILIYLDATLRPGVEAVHDLSDGMTLILFVGVLASLVLRWPSTESGQPIPEMSPASSGAMVVVATGLVAALFTGAGFHRAADFVLPAIILAATVGATWLVLRFARRHVGEIGEARFDTRNPGDGLDLHKHR